MYYKKLVMIVKYVLIKHGQMRQKLRLKIG